MSSSVLRYESSDEEEDDELFGDGHLVLRNEDVILLRQAFMNEKVAPEILPFKERLVRDLKDQIENQQAVIDETPADADEAFASELYQMEIDRIKYLLASYLRTRIFKLQKNVLYILGNEEQHSRLSLREFEFAKKYLNLIQGHLNERVLGELPDEYASLTSKYEGGEDNPAADTSMIPSPDLDAFVFCQVHRDVGTIVVDDDGNVQAQLNKGDLFASRYRCIQGLVEDGAVTLV